MLGFGPVVEEDTEDEYGFVHHASPIEKTWWIKKKPFSDEKGAIEFLKKWISRIREDAKSIELNPRSYRENYHREFLKIQAAIGDTVNLLAQHGTGLDEVRVRLGFELFFFCLCRPAGSNF